MYTNNMNTQILEKYAALLCNYCLELKDQDRVLVRTTTAAEPLLGPLYAEMLCLGAHPIFDIKFTNKDRIFYENASENALETPQFLYKTAVEGFDAMLTIDAPISSKELASIDPGKKSKHQAAQSKTRELFFKRSAKGDLRWSLCVFPTESAASECGMTLAEYTKFISKGCMLDYEDPETEWKALGEHQAKIVTLLSQFSEFRYKTNGTDISFSTQGRTWINSDGKRNMPSGEVFTSPVEDSVEGEILFSYPSRYFGGDVEGVRLRVKNGTVVEWHAEKGKETLDAVFAEVGANRFGEVAIGTNYNIQKFTHNTLFDEKIGGSIHMAVGASYPETGGKNKSSVHWDLVNSMRNGGQIIADGKLIYENGEFLPF